MKKIQMGIIMITPTINDRANKNQAFFQREEEIQRVNDENNYQV